MSILKWKPNTPYESLLIKKNIFTCVYAEAINANVIKYFHKKSENLEPLKILSCKYVTFQVISSPCLPIICLLR